MEKEREKKGKNKKIVFYRRKKQMKKYRWNYKIFLRNIAILILFIIYLLFISKVFTDFGKSPTCQYREHLESGGNWTSWSSLLQEGGEK